MQRPPPSPALGERPSIAPAPAPPEAATLPRTDSLRWLHILAALCVLVPLGIYAVFGFYRYEELTQLSEQRISRSLRAAQEHASKVLSSVESAQDRLLDQLDARASGELHAEAAALHQLLRRYVHDEPQIQSIWVMDEHGIPVASSRFSRLPPGLNYADRPYFAAHRQGGAGRYLSPPLVARTTGERIVDLSVRIDRADGSFGGVINVSLLSTYFEDFYGDLMADEPGLAVTLFNADGQIYARWPRLDPAPERLGPQSPVMQSLARGQDAARLRGTSSIDRQDRLLAYAKVGNYPLYVGTGMNLSVLRRDFLRELGVMLLLGVPPFAGLLVAATLAARRTRESIDAVQRLAHETRTRLQAEEALRQVQKLDALGRLTGGVAHDFNNALMVVSNSVALLRRRAPEDCRRPIDAIERSVASATQLTRQLLAFSRKQALAPERVRLAEWLGEVQALLHPVLGSRVRCTLDIAPDTRDVRVDRAELELAVLNLAINARDAMPNGGDFTLRAFNLPSGPGLPERVAIEASDTGSGIDPAVIDKVFEPFFTTKPVGQGTGLGLSQVYGVCARAGGTASIRSEHGRGTTVTMELAAWTGPDPADDEAVAPASGTMQRRIVLVEDHEDVAASLSDWLASIGCTVERFGSASEALAGLGAGRPLPDLVLSDVVMPGELNGLELAVRLRERWPGLPVLIMTGYAEQLEAIERAGFEMIPKPVPLVMLAEAIRRLTAGAA